VLLAKTIESGGLLIESFCLFIGFLLFFLFSNSFLGWLLLFCWLLNCGVCFLLLLLIDTFLVVLALLAGHRVQPRTLV